MDRLEDLRTDWQAHCQDLYIVFLREPDQTRKVRDWGERALVPHCFTWLRQRGAWPKRWEDDESALNRAQQQVAAALQHLPEIPPPIARMTLEVPAWSWSITAGLGTLIGMLGGAPLSLLLTGGRSWGVVTGGIVGGAALAALVGYFSARPNVRMLLSSCLVAGTALGGIGAIWSTLRGSDNALPFLRTSAAMLACLLVLYLGRARLRPLSGGGEDDGYETTVRQVLAHAADLVLGWTWSHPDRSAAVMVDPQKTAVPDAFIQAMTELQCAQRQESTDAQSSYVEVMTHLFEQLGFKWVFVDRGSPFSEGLQATFEPWGIEPAAGEPVRTIKPAITLRGNILVKGQLQRLKK